MIHEAKSERYIAYVGINGFDPRLREGGSNTIIERLFFLKRRGNKICVFNFLTGDVYKRFKLPINIAPLLGETEFHQVFLPFDFPGAAEKYGRTVGIIVRKLQSKRLCYVLAPGADILSMLSVYLLGIPSGYSFYSLDNVERIVRMPNVKEILRKGVVFANSNFIKSKLKELLGVEAVVWLPIISGERYFCGVVKSEKVGFCSGVSPLYKGGEIVGRLIQKMSNCKFVIAGERYYYQFNKHFPNVEYLSHISDMKRFYRRTKILLVPSLVEEAFGRVVIEAAINGIPVIANRVGGIPEAMGDSGILVDVDFEKLREDKDAEIERLANEYAYHINRLMKNKTEYEHYRQKALKRAKEYLEEQEANNLYIL